MLFIYAWFVGYRFIEHLGKPLDVPNYHEKLGIAAVRSKAATSLNSAGIFLAVSIAVLAAVMGSQEYRKTIQSWQSGQVLINGFAVATLLYLVIRQERVLSRDGPKRVRYIALSFLLAISVFVFLLGPYWFRSEVRILGPFVSRTALEPALPLAGFLLIIMSAFLQVFAIEFYDSASGWRGGDDKKGRNLRFHLAGLASHSFLIGISFALLGVSLLLSQITFWIGSATTLLTLVVLVALTEVERELWRRK